MKKVKNGQNLKNYKMAKIRIKKIEKKVHEMAKIWIKKFKKSSENWQKKNDKW